MNNDDKIVGVALSFIVVWFLFYMGVIAGVLYLIYRVLEHQNWI